jgi:Protein kinase domain/PEGA domain
VGMVVGTPQYMSPEQAKAIPADVRSDIYSLGLIIYELITGRPTFSAETPSMLMVKHVTEPPPPLRLIPGLAVPERLEALVMRMLEKEPSARPQTMDEVIAALEAVEQIPAPVKRSSRMGVWLGVGALALGAVGVVVLKRPAEVPSVTPVVVVEKPPVVEPVKVVEPPVEAPKVTAKVKLTFQTNAEKSEISEGGTVLGTTPFTLERDESALADLEFKAPGYKTVQRQVRFDSNQTIAIELEKEPPAPTKGAPARKKPPAAAEDPYAQE